MKLNKLTSRKFWLAVVSVIVGVMGILNYPESEIATVAGYLTALIPVVIYIITEGKIDAAGVKKIAEIVAANEVMKDDSL